MVMMMMLFRRRMIFRRVSLRIVMTRKNVMEIFVMTQVGVDPVREGQLFLVSDRVCCA